MATKGTFFKTNFLHYQLSLVQFNLAEITHRLPYFQNSVGVSKNMTTRDGDNVPHMVILKTSKTNDRIPIVFHRNDF